MPSIPQLPPRDSFSAVLDRYSDAFKISFNFSVYFLSRETYLVLFSTGSSPTQVSINHKSTLRKVSDRCQPLGPLTSTSPSQAIPQRALNTTFLGRVRQGEEKPLLENRKCRQIWFLHQVADHLYMLVEIWNLDNLHIFMISY